MVSGSSDITSPLIEIVGPICAVEVMRVPLRRIRLARVVPVALTRLLAGSAVHRRQASEWPAQMRSRSYESVAGASTSAVILHLPLALAEDDLYRHRNEGLEERRIVELPGREIGDRGHVVLAGWQPADAVAAVRRKPCD